MVSGGIEASQAAQGSLGSNSGVLPYGSDRGGGFALGGFGSPNLGFGSPGLGHGAGAPPPPAAGLLPVLGLNVCAYLMLIILSRPSGMLPSKLSTIHCASSTDSNLIWTAVLPGG